MVVDTIVWSLLVLIGLVALCAGAWAIGVPPVPAGLFFIVLGASLLRLILRARHGRAASILSSIGAAIRQNLPLPAALSAEAGTRKDKRSRILRRVAAFLIEGRPLSESIRLGYPACPGHALAMIAAAERIGQLPRAFCCIEADLAAQGRNRTKVRPVHPVYAVIVIVVMLNILVGLGRWVLPRFREVFDREFSAPLPAVTEAVFDFHGVFGGWAFLGAWATLMALLLVLYSKFRPRRPDRPRVLSQLGDQIKWHLPILRGYEIRFALVQVAGVLRLSLDAGCTVNAAIANTLALDVNTYFRRRLADWRDRVERGQDVASAARGARLGSSLAWAFDQQVNPAGAPEILASLADLYRASYDYRVNIARSVFCPCVVLGIAGAVGLTAYAIFLPLVTLIQLGMTTTVP